MSEDLESLISTNNNRHEKSDYFRRWKTHPRILLISILVGISLPILFPFCHILLFYLIWGTGENVVDPLTCSCNCWDTVFKGPYESGVAKYKHVYFNSTPNTLKMWTITVFFVIALYEVFKHVTILTFNKRLRPSMSLLLVGSIHSHYYAWWVHWNYWNDNFYSQWYHQLFFTLTELLSTSLVLFSLDKRRQIQPLPLIIVATVALFHISCAMWDQFFTNIFQLGGELHQVLRDVFLMVTDCVQVVVVLYELRQCAERKGVHLKSIVTQRPHLIAMLATTLSMLTYIILCP